MPTKSGVGYSDCYLLPIPEKNLAAYKKLAKAVGAIYREHGAIGYREYVGADLEPGFGVPLTKLAKVKPGEILIFAVIEFKNAADRKRINKSAMSDPRMEKLEPKPELFQPKRMIYGGFKTIVDA